MSQRFPGDSFILDAEAQLSELLKRDPRALDALQRAFVANKQSSYVATRLAAMYERTGDVGAAVRVLKECLDANATDKDLHFRLGRLLEGVSGATGADVRYHLRNSFTTGDGRYDAQFWYARSEYLAGNPSAAMTLFRDLGEANVDYREKRQRRGRVTWARFRGVVDRVDDGYAFILKDGDGSRVYAARADAGNGGIWSSLLRQLRVSFELAFNYYGPVALDIRREN